ncbi:MAG: leucine-rich repeat protein [Oscillospiraceae bacterium]|nr:leucine-rich repeat protein [Oscillospiraceae bacterium]
MKHRITALLTALSLCACSMPIAAQAAESVNTIGTYNGIEWDITDGVLTLGGSGDVIFQHGFPDEDNAIYPNWGYRDKIKTIVFGEGVTGADAEAFSGYPALETVVLSEGFDTFSAMLFKDCPNLREIQGIEHVEYFNMNCLSGTAMMEQDPFVIIDGELRYCDISESMNIVVPEGVTKICKDAFGNLSNLPYDFISDESQDIEDAKFTITLPETVETIEKLAFANLPALTSLNIPDSVTEIGDMAFFNCLRLESLTLGENVKKIGAYAFLNCKELKELTVSDKKAQLGEDAFGVAFDTERYVRDVVPEDKYEQYEEILKSDPNYFDTILLSRLDWFGSMDYLDMDALSVAEMLGVYSCVPKTQSIRGYINSTAHYYAHETGLHFTAIDDWTFALGDVNGDTLINALDASTILVEAANLAAGGSTKLTAEQMSRADVNADAAFNATDAAIILQYAAYTATGGTDSIEEFVK